MATNKKFLDENGLLYYDGKIKSRLATKVDKESGKGLSTNDYTTAEKTKLAGLKNYELPTATTDVKGGIKVGKGLAIDAETGVLNATGTEVKIDEAINSTSTNPVQNKVISAALDKKVNVVAGKVLSSNDYTNDEKTKLANIAEGANKTIVDTALSGTSTNPVQNKVINTALSNKVSKEDGKGLSTNDYTTEEKTKLTGIAEGANRTIVDDKISTTSTNPIQNKIITAELNKKVNAVSGKGLSTNDYTTAEKTKLTGIAAGAQVNIIESIKVNGTAQTVTNKAINITVPTNTNQLTNGAGFQNASQVSSAINKALEGITTIDYQVVATLPETGTKGTIYLKSNGGTSPNIYDEYIWITDKFEKIGTTEVDLTNYWNTTNLVALTNTEIDGIITRSIAG